MNGTLKGMLIVLTILYVMSPIDLMPGPVDDVLLILMMLASQKGQKRIEAS